MLARRLLLACCASVLTILIVAGSEGPLQAAPPKTVLAIVVSKDSALEAISSRDLKRVYLGERINGSDGESLIPLNQAANAPDRTGFERAALGMDPDEIGRYWIDRKIRGQSGPPKVVTPLERLRLAVIHVKGTLAYLRLNDVDKDLKVLSVDGKKPSDPGYALGY